MKVQRFIFPSALLLIAGTAYACAPHGDKHEGNKPVIPVIHHPVIKYTPTPSASITPRWSPKPSVSPSASPSPSTSPESRVNPVVSPAPSSAPIKVLPDTGGHGIK